MPTDSRDLDINIFRLFEESIDLLCVADVGGFLRQFNPAFERALGYSREELLKIPYMELLHPDDMESTLEAEQKLRSEQNVEYLENRLLCKNGEYKWLAWTAVPDLKSKLVFAVARDMSLAEASAGRIRKSEAILKRVEALTRMGHWYWNIQNSDLFWSSGTYELFGVSESEFTPSFEGFLERVHPEDREMVVAAVEETVAKDSPYDIEFRVIKSNGEMIYTRAQGTVLRNEDQMPLQMMGTIQDINEKKKLELQLRQSQKMEALGTLAGGIAHDFNNILAIIRGFSENIRDKVGDSSQSEIARSIDYILEAQERGKRLIDQILTFSRKESGKREPLVLAEAVKSAVNTLKATTPHHIEIRSKLEDGGLRVLSDPTQIHQIIFNVCSNSCQSMEERGGVIEIGLERDSLDSPHLSGSTPSVKLTIRDNGLGIPENLQDKVFDPFFTTKEVGKGTGLGLSVVHNIVKNLGGTISLKSKTNQGTLVTICLPTTDECLPDRNVSRSETPPSSRHGHILVVEDEPHLAELYQMNLVSLGYEVTVINNGMEASEKLHNEPDTFDLVITDHAMPLMTGKQIISQIQSLRPSLPVILASGYGELIKCSFENDVGVRKFLPKPFGFEDLRDAVAECLGSLEAQV
ncbi:MAG: PAS domain-containing protein [Bdellovibrionaceae bacterium]|nr:PAS domain-containing protein [Pseudobdellovibrionaceae bacterium]